MPEENFEEQARRKAEEFGMEPNADVWLHVQAAIRPERRRRVLLWWWLLPLCMAGIVGGFLLKRSGVMPERADAVALRAHPKIEELLPVEDPENAKTKRSVGNAKNNADENELKKKSDRRVNNQANKHGISKEPGEAWKNQYSDNKKKLAVQQEDDSGAEANSQTSDATITIIKRKAEELIFLPEEKGNALQANSGNNQASLPADSMGSHDKATPAITFAGKDSAVAKSYVTKTTEQKKKMDKKKWQMGVVTEIGLTSWGKDLLTKEVETTNKYNTVPTAADAATIDSLQSVTSESQRTKNGVDAGIGFTMRKEIGHHFYISGQVGYRYQQYQVYNLRTSSGTFLNSTSGYLVNKNNYHSHFISLYAGVGKMLFTGKHNALSVEAGLDNSLLLTTGQQNTNQTALYNADANKNTRADFYRWQPQMFLSLPFDWHATGKVRFTVSPFARVGLHDYQKNTADYRSNHLMSAGVQAVYFFR